MVFFAVAPGLAVTDILLILLVATLGVIIWRKSDDIVLRMCGTVVVFFAAFLSGIAATYWSYMWGATAILFLTACYLVFMIFFGRRSAVKTKDPLTLDGFS